MAAPALAQNAAPYRDCTALPPNLVDNCGFEQAPVGDEIVPGWGVTFGDGSEPALTLGPTTELPHSGSGVLVFQPAGGNDPDTVTQSLPHLQPSSTYQFGVWWYGGVVTPESIPDSSGTFDAYVDGVVGGTQYAVKKTSEDTYAPGWSFSMVNFTTAASGTPQVGVAGLEGRGVIRSGYLETSNVNIVEELVEMIECQRAYEISSKMVSAVDEMLRNANQTL